MNRRGISLLLIGILICLTGVFWWLTELYKREYQRFEHEQIDQHVEATKAQIESAMKQALPRAPTFSESIEQLVNEGMRQLISTQRAVKAVLVVDPQERIYGAESAADLPLHDTVLANPRGFPAATVIHEITSARANLEVVPFDLTLNGSDTGWDLVVIIDTTPPVGLENRARLFAAGEMLMIVALIGAVVWIMAMQQRTAHRLRQERDRSEHLAYIGTLAAGLAHEIRNPINALAMQLEMLEEDVARENSPRSASRVQRIRGGLVGVERTVSEFLNYAAPGQQKPAMVDLAEQLGALCREFSAEQNQGEGTVDCQIPAGLAAWCDVNALRQIVGNLLSNAWRIQQPGERRIRVEGSRNGEWAQITIDDAGPGVPEELREQIFDCFFSTRGDGTGLGLPIGQRLAEMNGGRLDLAPHRSPLGGARFVLRLPVRQPLRHG